MEELQHHCVANCSCDAVVSSPPVVDTSVVDRATLRDLIRYTQVMEDAMQREIDTFPATDLHKVKRLFASIQENHATLLKTAKCDDVK
jgi:hypothetical protein